MLGFSLFKTAKYKRFEFHPRYYDERKERREELIKQLEEEDEIKQKGSIGEYKSHLNKGYLTELRKKSKQKDSSNSSNIRIAIIIAVLFALAYWLLH